MSKHPQEPIGTGDFATDTPQHPRQPIDLGDDENTNEGHFPKSHITQEDITNFFDNPNALEVLEKIDCCVTCQQKIADHFAPIM